MKHAKEEILKALHVIKDTCKENVRCDDNCPFQNSERCLITDRQTSPDKWKINDDNVLKWKGLL